MLSGIFRFNTDDSEHLSQIDHSQHATMFSQLEEAERHSRLSRTLSHLYRSLRSKLSDEDEATELMADLVSNDEDIKTIDENPMMAKQSLVVNPVTWLDHMNALQIKVIDRTSLENAIETRQGIIELAEPGHSSLAQMWIEALTHASQVNHRFVNLTQSIQLTCIQPIPIHPSKTEKITNWIIHLVDQSTNEHFTIPLTEVRETITLTPNFSQIENLHLAHNAHYPLIEQSFQHNPNRPTLYSNQNSLALMQSQLLEDALIQIAAGHIQQVDEAIRHMQNLAVLQDRANILIRQSEKPSMRKLLESALIANQNPDLIHEIRAAKYRPFDRAQRIAREQVMLPQQLPMIAPEKKEELEFDPFAMTPIAKLRRLTEGPEHKPWLSQTLMAYKERARTQQHSRQAINSFFQAPVVSSADIVQNILHTEHNHSHIGLFHPKIIQAMRQSRSIVIHRGNFLGISNPMGLTQSHVDQTAAEQWRSLITIQNPGMSDDQICKQAETTAKLEITPDDWLSVAAKVSPKLMTSIMNDHIQQLKKLGKWRHLPNAVELLESTVAQNPHELEKTLNRLYNEAEINNRMVTLILLINKPNHHGHYVTIVYQPTQKRWLSLDAINTHLDGVQSVHVFANKSELLDLLLATPNIIVPRFINAV